MTVETMITRLTEFVDDVLDDEVALSFLNLAKTEVEDTVDWNVLRKSQSYSVSRGYSYTSALGTLPTDFSLDLTVIESAGFTEYQKVDFQDLYMQQIMSYGYFIDLANNNIHLTGENHSAKTIVLRYKALTAEFELANIATDTWVFPAQDHIILPLKAAQLYYAADGGEKSRSWDDRWRVYYTEKMRAMQTRDARLSTRNRAGRYAGYGNPKGISFSI